MSTVRTRYGLFVWLVFAGCSPEPADVSPPTRPSSQTRATPDDDSPRWFTEVTDQASINVRHRARGARGYFFPAIMSPGAGWIDYDNDGDLDILIASGSFLPPNSPAAKLDAADPKVSAESANADVDPSSTPHLLRQEPDHTFVDVTQAAGLAIPMYCQGLAVGDVNSDGFPDVYLTGFGGDRLLLNQAGKQFQDVTEAAGIRNRSWSTSVAFVDYDRDGWLDLFVCNYIDYDPTHPCLTNQGKPDFCNPAAFGRLSSKLYRNRTGESVSPTSVQFEDRSLASGIALHRGAGLGVACADFNQDGWPDIYVANDGHANFLWINQKNGSFAEEALISGIAYDNAGHGQGSMGVAAEDLNGDLAADLFVTNLDGEANVLYLTAQRQGFIESANSAGLGQVSFPFTGFGAAFLDADRDGDLDLAIVNGRVRRKVSPAPLASANAASADEFWNDYREANLLFVNQGSGKFRRVTPRGDDFLATESVSRALAAGDYDDDGDVDLLVTTAGGPTRLFRNDAASTGHWLTIRACAPKLGGRDAIGADMTVVAGPRRWRRRVNPATSYLSSHDPRVHFGLGDATRVDAVEITWPDGQEERFVISQVDRQWTLMQGSGETP